MSRPDPRHCRNRPASSKAEREATSGHRYWLAVQLAPKRMESEINVNQMLHDHQVVSLMAQHAQLRVDREAYGKRVGERAKRITDWRKSAGLSAIGWPNEPSACGPADVL